MAKRSTNINGLKAIIKYNVMKALAKQNLSKQDYGNIIRIVEEYILNAKLEDLKQKGIVKKIINLPLTKIIKGEGKRKREEENDDENKRKLFQSIDPSKIKQLTLPETSSTVADVLKEPNTKTQNMPKQRSLFNRLFLKRPQELEKNKEPHLRPHNSWFDPYITGRVLPTARERRNHYTRDDADIDRQRHQILQHRILLNELPKDISRRRDKQELQIMSENEEIRRKAVEDESLLLLEAYHRNRHNKKMPIASSSSSSNTSSSSSSSIAKRREELIKKYSKT